MESIKEKEERLASYKFEMEHIYEGFVFKRSEQLKDIKCDGYLFEHEKTKAKLVYIKSPDANKVFSIYFDEDIASLPDRYDSSFKKDNFTRDDERVINALKGAQLMDFIESNQK